MAEEDEILTEEDTDEGEKKKLKYLTNEASIDHLLFKHGPSVLGDLRKTMRAIDLRIRSVQMRIEFYQDVIAENEVHATRSPKSMKRVEACIKGLQIALRNYMELRERMYRMADEVMRDKDSEYRKLFKAHFMDGMSKKDLCKMSGATTQLVQKRIYNMYCDFYDNDGINPINHQRYLERKAMWKRTREEREKCKASHSQSTEK